MSNIGIVHATMVKEIATSIKDDLAHTILHALPINSIYALAALYEQDNQRASDLAKKIGAQATSFTPTIDRLEALGLVERVPNANDRRAIIICLTKDGKTYKAAVQQAIGNAEVRYGGK